MKAANNNSVGDKNIIINLRFRWPELVKDISDLDLIQLYDDFAICVDENDEPWHGNNDERWPEFLEKFK